MKKSEEIDNTNDEAGKKQTPSGTHLTPGRVKRSARVPSSGLSDETVLKEKKIEMAGKKVVGGRVMKGSGPTGRKKTKEEDEFKMVEVVRLE